METYNNLHLNPNAKAIFCTFKLEEMLENSGNICYWDKL
jgi:hypothetical protein